VVFSDRAARRVTRVVRRVEAMPVLGRHYRGQRRTFEFLLRRYLRFWVWQDSATSVIINPGTIGIAGHEHSFDEQEELELTGGPNCYVYLYFYRSNLETTNLTADCVNDQMPRTDSSKIVLPLRTYTRSGGKYQLADFGIHYWGGDYEMDVPITAGA